MPPRLGDVDISREYLLHLAPPASAAAPNARPKRGARKTAADVPAQESLAQPGPTSVAAPTPKGGGKKAGNGQPDRKPPASSTRRKLPAPDTDGLKDERSLMMDAAASRAEQRQANQAKQ